MRPFRVSQNGGCFGSCAERWQTEKADFSCDEERNSEIRMFEGREADLREVECIPEERLCFLNALKTQEQQALVVDADLAFDGRFEGLDCPESLRSLAESF